MSKRKRKTWGDVNLTRYTKPPVVSANCRNGKCCVCYSLACVHQCHQAQLQAKADKARRLVELSR